MIPKEIKTLLCEGEISTEAVPQEKFNTLHHEYVCSCVLRIAREVLAILPSHLVIVTALEIVPSCLTGNGAVPILSVAFTRSVVEMLNLEEVMPLEAISRFVHHLAFDTVTGFEAVTALVPADFL